MALVGVYVTAQLLLYVDPGPSAFSVHAPALKVPPAEVVKLTGPAGSCGLPRVSLSVTTAVHDVPCAATTLAGSQLTLTVTPRFLTMIEALSVAVLKAVVPPFVEVGARSPLAPLVR